MDTGIVILKVMLFLFLTVIVFVFVCYPNDTKDTSKGQWAAFATIEGLMAWGFIAIGP